jgi:hypothetical protein
MYGNGFLLVTDHQLLKWLMELDKLTGKLARWALMLMEYDFKVVHRAGLVNMDADVEDGEDSLPGWHCSAFLCLLAMHGDTTGEAIVATLDADAGEESGNAKDIFEDEDVMLYLKVVETKATWSSKERDRILQ